MKMPVWRHSWKWLKQTSEKPPSLLKYRSSSIFICFVVSVATFTDIFLYGVIVPVIPFALNGRSGMEPGQVQYWVSVLIAVYGAALLAFSPICGYFADHTTSRRSPLLLGLVALAGATVMLNVGSSIGVLIIGRILQGISAAVVWVVGLALLVDTVGPDSVGQAMGYVGLAMSLGILLAPLLGGVVFENGGYNAVFGMAYGLIAVDIVLRLLVVEKKIARKWIPDDGDRSERNEESVPEVIEDVDGEKANGTSDVERDPESVSPPQNSIDDIRDKPKSKRKRLPPLVTLLASRRLLAALWGIFVQATLMTSFDSVLPLFVKRTFGWDSTGAGLIFLPLVVPSFIQPVIGWISDKYGPRWPSTIGFLLVVPVYVCLCFVTENNIRQKVLLCALLALLGMAVSFALAPLIAEISYVVAAKEKKMKEKGEDGFGEKGAYAQAYGLFNMAFAGGCLVGPVWGGMLVDKAGWGIMCWSLGLLSGITVVPTFLLVGGWIGIKRKKGGGEVDTDGQEITQVEDAILVNQ